MKKNYILSLILAVFISMPALVLATGEASTYFQIFVPPNNDPVGRDVCLIVTAVYDSTSFDIVDDNADGDSDDSVSGMLMAGQSYILYIREGGINDDAPHSGEGQTKQDGDYFIVTSDKLVLCSQSTKSDWQHDWVPATNKSSKGQKFIIYSPPTTFSNRDLNVFAYENDTEITIRKISWANQTASGYTNVDMQADNIVIQKTIDIGEDLIFYNTDGRNIMETGATYVIESNKEITVQYGALWQNARDGGGYVPSSNGSSSGELFYFTVPYQAAREQEIRIVSWNDNNSVALHKYQNGNWISVDSWNLDNMEPGDWVSYSGNIDKVFRVSCSAGKKVSVFEANWLETGSPGTSDVASMLSAASGATSGTQFLAYMAPPGKENNVTDPFTGNKFDKGSHLYFFSREGATVTVKDMDTQGGTINRSYTIAAGRYADCYLDLQEWYSIYNGDGNPNSGSERPYLIVESDNPVSVFNTNFNDNWMAYFGSSQTQDISVNTTVSSIESIPGDTITLTGTIEVPSSGILNPDIEVQIGNGATALSGTLEGGGQTLTGNVYEGNENTLSKITFDNEPDLQSSTTYTVNTQLVLNTQLNDGTPIPDRQIVPVEIIVSGVVDGVFQQTASTEGITNNSADQSNMMFSDVSTDQLPSSDVNSNWSVSFSDYNNDGHDDVFITTYDPNLPNMLYKNNGYGSYSKMSLSPFTTDKASSVAACWGDYNNDGYADLFVANNVGGSNFLYRNNNGTSFTKITQGEIVSAGTYCHSAAWADYDNDGFIDLFIAEYMPTKNNLLFRNKGDGTFEKVEGIPVVMDVGHSIGAAWCDYNNDGYSDLFVPNTNAEANYLYKNLGNGKFERVSTSVLPDIGTNSVGCSWGDINNDGYFDLFVVNAGNQNNELFINNQGGSFTRITSGEIIASNGHSHGSSFGDLDNDGDLDLYITNDQDKSKFLFLNNGDATFTRNTDEIITAAAGNTFANALSDIDRDGDLDILAVNHEEEANYLFKNNGNSNHYLQLVLHGTISNAQAIGAVVKVKPNGSSEWIYRQITSQTGGGAGSQNSSRCHFGLGAATSVDNLVIKWPSGFISEYTNIAADQILTYNEQTGKQMGGRVYVDANSNNAYDSGETTIGGVKISISPGDIVFYTDADGQYSANLNEGSYTLSMDTPMWYNQSYPASNGSHSIAVTSSSSNRNDLDFIVSSSTNQPDLEVALSTTMLRRGFKNDFTVVYKNAGTSSASTNTLSMVFPDGIIPLSSTLPWDDKNGNTLTWSFASIPQGEEVTFYVTDSVSINNDLGEMKTVSLSMTSQSSDLNTSNNTAEDVNEVVGSVDPNDKLAYPQHSVKPGEFITYKIRFQNVGNFPAEHVAIHDTLSFLLDPGTIKDLTTSHEYTFKVIDKNILIWEFPEIWLADSVHNEPESHGYVQFRIKPKQGLSYGTEVPNKATIIFDYFQHTPTNTVEQTIEPEFDYTVFSEFVCYPNPFSDHLKIEFKHVLEEPVEYQLLNMASQVLISGSLDAIEGWNKLEPDVSQIPSGMYMLLITGSEKEFVQRVVRW